MDKRCETINNGQPCPYLAEDGTCLLKPQFMKHYCPALEKVGHEDKDEWIGRKRKAKTNGGIGTLSLEDIPS